MSAVTSHRTPLPLPCPPISGGIRDECVGRVRLHHGHLGALAKDYRPDHLLRRHPCRRRLPRRLSRPPAHHEYDLPALTLALTLALILGLILTLTLAVPLTLALPLALILTLTLTLALALALALTLTFTFTLTLTLTSHLS
jgi:hypothetical protein